MGGPSSIGKSPLLLISLITTPKKRDYTLGGGFGISSCLEESLTLARERLKIVGSSIWRVTLTFFWLNSPPK
jgi:hypothetical protein